MKKQEKIHKEKLSGMGCIVCFHIHGPHDPGPVELHHLRSGGWGKGDYRTLIPLCYNHHQGAEGIHTMGTKAWERHFDVSQQDLLTEVMERI
jgi:hypothetical protein